MPAKFDGVRSPMVEMGNASLDVSIVFLVQFVFDQKLLGEWAVEVTHATHNASAPVSRC